MRGEMSAVELEHSWPFVDTAESPKAFADNSPFLLENSGSELAKEPEVEVPASAYSVAVAVGSDPSAAAATAVSYLRLPAAAVVGSLAIDPLAAAAGVAVTAYTAGGLVASAVLPTALGEQSQAFSSHDAADIESICVEIPETVHSTRVRFPLPLELSPA